MTTEQQVCTLEQSIKLVNLGIDRKIETLLLWLDYRENPHGAKIVFYDTMDFETERGYIYPAFTVAELGVMLPEWLYVKDKEYRRQQWQNVKEQYPDDFPLDEKHIGFMTCYEETKQYSIDRVPQEEIHGTTEAQVRANILIYLLENFLIPNTEVNERLKLTL